MDRKVHTAEHLASAMFYLGVPQTEIPRARLFAAPSSRGAPYAVLHPMASVARKDLAGGELPRLSRASGRPIWDRAGLHRRPERKSRPAFAEYPCLQGAPLEEVKSLLAGAALFIGNDSGPAHIAAAFGRPVVVLFGSSDLDNWRPWRTENVVLNQPRRHSLHRRPGGRRSAVGHPASHNRNDRTPPSPPLRPALPRALAVFGHF